MPMRDESGHTKNLNAYLGRLVRTEAENYIAKNKSRKKPRVPSRVEEFEEKFRIAKPFMLADDSMTVAERLELAREAATEKAGKG